MTREEIIILAAEEYVAVMLREGEIFQVSDAEAAYRRLVEAVTTRDEPPATERDEPR